MSNLNKPGKFQNQKPGGMEECHLVYLDNLRESGETNMFGAAPFLVRDFGLQKTDAQEYLQHWMNTFEARHENRNAT